jgi:transcription antitermination protein NusB
MGKRREGREAAIQYLYQLDLNGHRLSSSTNDFWELRSLPGAAIAPPKLQTYADAIITGVLEHQAAIDERIQQLAANYELGRIAAVDRNVLRVAIWEMLYCPDIPPVVSINEAIEIAKRFGSEESGRFVNGILDKVRGELKRSSREPAAPRSAPSARPE